MAVCFFGNARKLTIKQKEDNNEPSRLPRVRQCACHNPLWTAFENQQSLDKIKEQISQSLVDKTEQDNKAFKKRVMYSGGYIRPMIGGSTEQVEAIGFAEGKVVAVGDIGLGQHTHACSWHAARRPYKTPRPADFAARIN
ncbi:hypothetical protein JF50_14875 [Pseudoalteromonas luteoviolacea]|uniref:Uncharacterized protein n=1 Tax=Pseudoalteromonas luteoviolacea TaxID=43657 RepID=A0A0C1QKX8_9GAMM|nr:hypothetical protein [Pseudoalteromonas luteoviolacea]KID55672.1 hypothetical protein JF50_14875 [Pseudoalteromonas luteoviolacea]